MKYMGKKIHHLFKSTDISLLFRSLISVKSLWKEEKYLFLKKLCVFFLNKPFIMCPSAWVATKPLRWWPGGHIAFMIAYMLRPSCFCKIWAFCVSIMLFWTFIIVLCNLMPAITTLCIYGSVNPIMHVFKIDHSKCNIYHTKYKNTFCMLPP